MADFVYGKIADLEGNLKLEGPLDPTHPICRDTENMLARALREEGEQSVTVRTLKHQLEVIARYNARFTEQRNTNEMTEDELWDQTFDNCILHCLHVTLEPEHCDFLIDEELDRRITELYEKEAAAELSELHSGKELVQEEDYNRGLEGRQDEKSTENESLEHLKENVAIRNTSSTKDLEPTREEDKDYDTILVESVPDPVSGMDLEASRKNKLLKNADCGGIDEYIYEPMKKPRNTWV